MTEIEKRAPDKIYQINQTHLLTKSFITKTKTIAIFMNMRTNETQTFFFIRYSSLWYWCFSKLVTLRNYELLTVPNEDDKVIS